MSLFEKKQLFSGPSPSSPRPGPVPPKFNPSSKPISIPRRPISAVKKTTTPAKTLFEEKKDWERAKFLGRTTKDPLSIKGKMYGSYERKKMIEKEFPIRRFGTYISKGEAKTRLTEMGREAKGKERARLGGLKKYLEKGTGLKKKY